MNNVGVEKPLLRVKEAATLSRGVFGEAALREAIRRKQVPAVFIGRKVFIARAPYLRLLGLSDPE